MDNVKDSRSSLKSIIPLLNMPFDRQSPVKITNISYQEKKSETSPYSLVESNLVNIGLVISESPFCIIWVDINTTDAFAAGDRASKRLVSLCFKGTVDHHSFFMQFL